MTASHMAVSEEALDGREVNKVEAGLLVFSTRVFKRTSVLAVALPIYSKSYCWRLLASCCRVIASN